MAILGGLVLIVALGVAVSAVRGRRKANARADLADLRSAADLTSTLLIGGALLHGMHHPDSGGGFDGGPIDVAPPDIGGGDFGGGGMF